MGLMTKYLKAPRLRTRESFVGYIEKWVVLSSVLGLLTGFVVALFDYVTNLKLWTYFSALLSENPYLIIPLSTVAFVVSGYLLTKSSNHLGSGTEEIVKAYNLPEEIIDSRSFPQKMVAAVLTIGLGGSAGQEGPSVYAGGVMGKWVWSRLRKMGLTRDDKRILILAGAAAGIGAVFKAPLTGIIFALEVPFKDDLAHDALVPSLISAVVSYLTLVGFDGSEPLFRFPGIASVGLVDIGASAVLGVVCGAVVLVFISVYKNVGRAVSRLSSKFYYRALVGAAVVSTIGIVSVLLFHHPYPLGISYDMVQLAQAPGVSPITLSSLFVMKMLATSFTLGTTGVGGIFIPQIVMGASLGGLFGEVFSPSRVDLFVAVGMASFLAAGYKTPLAAVAFVAETTFGPSYLIPSLVAAAVSYAISGEASVSEYQKLRAEIDITQIANLQAKDIMTKKVVAVPAEISVLDFIEEYLFQYRLRTFPVVDKDGLVGMISVNEINGIPQEKRHVTSVIDVCSKDVHCAYPDTPVQEVLDIMHGSAVPRVPIVDRSKAKRIIGIVSETDILAALEKERLS